MSLAGPLAKVHVDNGEILARFIFSRRYLQSGFVKAEALLPYKHVNLSVSRHRDLSEADLWALGEEVAVVRSASAGREFQVHGRADLLASDARDVGFNVDPDEPPRNHANISGWPAEKSAQMMLAQELAARSKGVIR